VTPRVAKVGALKRAVGAAASRVFCSAGCAASQSVGEVNRHIGDALQAANRHRQCQGNAVETIAQAAGETLTGWNDFVAHLLARRLLETRQAQQIAEHAQDFPRRARIAEGTHDSVETLRATLGV
jgi:hypothetical protein